ncbi:MAG: thiamine pyrophosphate-dependent enzyme, partial [Myxococcota bacterium]
MPPPLGERTAAPERAVALRLYENMALARALELRVVELYRQNRITGGCYTAIGNEATSVGAATALEMRDVLVPTHRDMGAHLVRGHSV